MKELPKIYEPQRIEDEIYARWEQGGFFNPDNSPREIMTESHIAKRISQGFDSNNNYCNVLPPPNANGELHIGHASGYTVMDIFGRYARMNGKKTLLLPGKDHAGIQTQVVFEKKLAAETGVSRHEIGREEFYKKTYDFCMDRSAYMRSQEKKIGISADWSREKFTLDPEVLKNALETFVKMHADGLIYKGKRIINWCPRCATALSDVEVLHKDTPGKLYFIKYPLENSSDFITVATTRPETMLGDTAVAVNPDDERFTKLVGKNVILPLQNTIISIIADKRIDLSFGTGAVKITPSHDPLDWEIGKDHNLEEIQIIDEKALITELGGKYAGLSSHEAREQIVVDLEKLNLMEKIEELAHSVSICERCKTTIEPLTSNQWFIDVDAKNYSLKNEAKLAIENSEINIFPSNFQKILVDWFDNMRDWCISRQIWWGPQFPVWYKGVAVFSDLEKLKKDKLEIMAGEEGSPVCKKQDPEYRFVLDSKEDFEWVRENIQIGESFEYADFFDGKNRTRISDKNFTITEKEAPCQGVVEKSGKKCSFKGKKVSLEERRTVGFARYEIEFKGILPEYFENKQQISSTEILSHQDAVSEGTSVYINLEKPFFEEGWVQDENTFDTWFTSGQWAYTTLKSHGNDFEFYPSDMMIMGRDLLSFWSSRMIMMGLYCNKQVPFKNLFFTGLVRDKDGHKFSKSRGNGIDPLLMIDKFGADAMRMSLIMDSAPGQDSRLYEEKIETFRNFANKLWNISRYCLTHENFKLIEKISDDDLKTPCDRWIISNLNKKIEEINRLFEGKQIAVAADVLKSFTWNEFADWYLEINKIEKNQKVLGYVLDKLLRLWHPFMPFITEHIWDLTVQEKMLIVSAWPRENSNLPENIQEFEVIQEIITTIRNARTENKIALGKKITITINSTDEEIIKILTSEFQEDIIKKLKTGVETIQFNRPESELAGEIKRTIGKINLYIHLAEAVDTEKEKTRIEKEIINIENFVSGLAGRLSNKDFVSKAPEQVINQQKETLAKKQAELSELKKHLGSLS